MRRRYKYRKRRRYNTSVRQLHKRISGLNRKVDGENKFTDRTATASFTTTGSVGNLQLDMATGDTPMDDYTGMKVKYKSLLIRGKVAWNASAPNALVRMMIVQRLINISTTPTLSSAGGGSEVALLEYSGTADYVPLAPLDHQNRNSYRVLANELMIGNPDSTDNVCFEKFIKLNHRVIFHPEDGAVKKGGLFILFVSDEITNPPTYHYWSRIKFVDN